MASKMGNIVQQLVANEWSDERIAKELGMDREEVFRFKQRSGLKSAFLTMNSANLGLSLKKILQGKRDLRGWKTIEKNYLKSYLLEDSDSLIILLNFE